MKRRCLLFGLIFVLGGLFGCDDETSPPEVDSQPAGDTGTVDAGTDTTAPDQLVPDLLVPDAPPPPTCKDNKHNGKETDTDCGGGACPKCADGKKCSAAADCVSGVCDSGKCVTPSCTDKVKNGTETDVDCGGTCPACGKGKACSVAGDCVSGVCDASGTCQEATCTDKVKNGSETDVDCGGGTCPTCADGNKCAAGGDCASGVCSAGVCVAASCADKVKNGKETDVDCGGGTCPKCADTKGCAAAGDCASGVCSSGKCAAPTCTDTIKNGAETDVDCGGGTCPKCADTKGCAAAGDCASGVCDASGMCAAPTCTDKVKNGDETDVDCGGPACARCADTKDCKASGDCVSGVCSSGKCAAPTCTDTIKNGAETDVDCGGGACAKCADTKGCGAATDCVSGVCDSSGKCAAPTCSDTVNNGAEADVDCGGPTCSQCAVGKNCGAAKDCTSGVCAAGVCSTPTCTDKIKNGSETDVDCGGASCPKCADSRICKAGTDCVSGVCASGICAAPTCTDKIKNGSETDVDCGGSCSACSIGKVCKVSTDCLLGVCASAKCRVPTDCNELLKAHPYTKDGTYTINPCGTAISAKCDMTTDGGGWTEITLDLARNKLGGKMVAVDSASSAGFDSSHRPYTRDGSDRHTYHYTFSFCTGYDEFILHNYVARANGSNSSNTADIYPSTFKQTKWSLAHTTNGVGDISFGSPDDAGPVTSYAKHLTSNFDCYNCTLKWPPGSKAFKLSKSTKNGFRIGWGEGGGQSEGWYPWWSGTIKLRGGGACGTGGCPAKLVGHWKLDEGSGSAAKDEFGFNNLTVVGAKWATGTSCKTGACLKFAGNNVARNTKPTGLPLGAKPRTVALWFNPGKNLVSSTESGLVQYGTASTGQMFSLITSLNKAGRLYFYGHSRDVAGTTSLKQGTWYHGAVTYDGKTVKLYVNGKLEGSASHALNTVHSTYGLTIGQRPTSIYWIGLIDDVRIYDNALTASQIAALAQ